MLVSRGRTVGSSQPSAVQILQCRNFRTLIKQGAYSARRCMRRRECSNARDVIANGGAANGFFVVKGFTPERGIDDQIDLRGFHQVDDIGSAFVYFEYFFGFNSRGIQGCGGPPRSQQFEAERVEFLAERA